MTRSMALISIILVLSAGLAHAAVKQGDTEISLGGYYQRFGANDDQGVSGPTLKNFSINGGYGYFVTDNIQVAGILGYSSFDNSNGNTFQYTDIGVQGKYHFRVDEPLVPYAGLELIYNMGLDTGKAFVAGDKGNGHQIGIGGGIRYELNPKNDFFIEIWYKELGGDWKSSSVSSGGVNVKNLTHLRLGIIHQFN